LAIFALLAPAGTPEPIIAKLHREAVRILTEATVIQTTGNG
jgi:tripartite-type tricarboxylate transporter receptor subunit TctC